MFDKVATVERERETEGGCLPIANCWTLPLLLAKCVEGPHPLNILKHP